MTDSKTILDEAPLVLVVDDQRTLRFIANRALTEAGFEVMEAADGEQAIAALEERLPDLVLLDVVMPGMDGFAVCERIRAQPDTADLPVIIMTALDDENSIVRSYDVGATDFIGKPFSAVVLVQRVRYVLRAQRSERRILELAEFDSLTKVANRESFRKRLQEAVAIAERYERNLAVLFLDLDDFKRINDTLGHDIGDLLLKEVANRLVHSVRGGDAIATGSIYGRDGVVGRLGGDEFLVKLPEIRRGEDAAKVAGRILHAMGEPCTLEGHEMTISTSIGISLFPQDGTDADTLLKNADTAMYAAKRSGKNEFQFYDAGVSAAAQRRLTLDNHLRKALEHGELSLNFQPMMQVDNSRICALEALLRWQNDALGSVSPEEFISLAEENRTIVAIGEWVLRTACQEASRLHALGFDALRMAVNISLAQFSQKNFVDMVGRSLSDYGLSPEYLELEITESVLAKNVSGATQTLQDLKQLGVQLAIDDFGTGYSSLSHLKQLPIDRLKIDRSFVQDVVDDPDDAAIATAIIAMAQSMRLAVTSEGVENDEQFELLKLKGSDEIQGYWLSRPLPSTELRQFLAGRT